MFCCHAVLDLCEGVHVFFFFFLENSLEMLREPGLSSVTPGTEESGYCTLFFYYFVLISSVPDFYLRDGLVHSQRFTAKSY